MTDLQEKAMRMALERLESHEYWMDERAIQALRQALAQPEQETKREWVGLTKEEVYGIANTAVGKTFTDMTREIEAKLKEKNT